jgi:hypothetical protein
VAAHWNRPRRMRKVANVNPTLPRCSTQPSVHPGLARRRSWPAKARKPADERGQLRHRARIRRAPFPPRATIYEKVRGLSTVRFPLARHRSGAESATLPERDQPSPSRVREGQPARVILQQRAVLPRPVTARWGCGRSPPPPTPCGRPGRSVSVALSTAGPNSGPITHKRHIRGRPRRGWFEATPGEAAENVRLQCAAKRHHRRIVCPRTPKLLCRAPALREESGMAP